MLEKEKFPRTRITIEEVAESAGVSIKTVSRVVNKEANVSEKTRTKVQAVIKQLNYQPNYSARALAGRRSNLIGLLYDNPSPNYLVSTQNGILRRCQEEGFHMVLQPSFYSNPDLAEEVIGMMQQTQLDGLILTPPFSGLQPFTEQLQNAGIEFVCMAPPKNHADTLLGVRVDDAAAAQRMTEYLIELGHKRIGFIIGHPKHSAAAERLEGYQRALDHHGIAYDPSLVVQGYFSSESGRDAAKELLSLRKRPSAIFASNDDMAIGAIMAAHEHGLSLPEELSICGFDDTDPASLSWPRLTTMHQPITDMAYAATGILIHKVKTGNVLPAPTDLGFDLVKRESTTTPAK